FPLGMPEPSMSPEPSAKPSGVLELGSRQRSQAPPPEIIWEALTDPYRPKGRQWLTLARDEVPPRILESIEPRLVVWSSLWPSRPNDQIRFDIAGDQSGSMLRWTLLSPDDPPDRALLGHLRYRLNFLINGELRLSFGQ
ncbi:MAG TPA: hypothetical protein VKY26_06655, partial [Actinomycetota bacterium]|nr:hypothetical protein [Actinomycetota bacterium]